MMRVFTSRKRDMIVTRAIYDAVHRIYQQDVDYDPDNPEHQAMLEAAVAEIIGTKIVLTFKGELVLDL